jgi:glycolate oxidase
MRNASGASGAITARFWQCGCVEPCAAQTSVAMLGTVTGEHGVGIEKLNGMCVQFSADENAPMFGVKHAFDPKGLRNPGKVIPTLQRCAEYGKLLVRGGQLPHPELPRF